jgi:NAD-dependent SIR2 family protein deacetylase
METHPTSKPVVKIDPSDRAGGVEPRDRNVYLLGAGFSAPAGAPLIHNFLDCSRAFLDAPFGFVGDFNAAQREPFETVFKYKQDMSRAAYKVKIDLDNIEELFGLVDISSRLDPGQQKIRDSTAMMIARTLDWATRDIARRPKIRIGSFPDAALWFRQFGLSPESFHVDKTVAGDFINMDLYTYFAALITGIFDDPSQSKFRNDSVITFNYDLVLDYALDQANIAPDYHLPSPEEDPHWKPPSRTCSLLKLHGSINWGVCSKCRTQLRIAYRQPSSSPIWYPPQSCPQCKSIEQFFQPLLVPPSWDKSGHRDILTSVWAKAVEELKAAKRICVIGYSMPKSDAFFRYLLTLALAENERLSDLIVVDLARPVMGPTQRGETLETRWKELLEPMFVHRRFHFHPEGLIEYVLDRNNLHHLGRGEALNDKSINELTPPPR